MTSYLRISRILLIGFYECLVHLEWDQEKCEKGIGKGRLEITLKTLW